MAGRRMAHIEIDGQDATVEQLRAASVAHYGHFTAMQVRDRRVRGLDLHLARLDAANQEVFGTGLDTAQVRDHLRHALGETRRAASVRISVYETPGETAMMVTVRPPAGMQPTPWRLQAVPYQRPLAHIKHLADFGQSYFRRLAHRNRFDEALLTGPGGVICEGSITNTGFFDGGDVVWPDAPALAGITMQILERTLPAHGVSSRRARVHTADLGSFATAFVTNSHGIAPVGQIDDLILPVDGRLTRMLTEAYESAGWDPI
jgi:branched-subunit amino acid aminotransferase/4-amino-4-deoxychorismate lyase